MPLREGLYDDLPAARRAAIHRAAAAELERRAGGAPLAELAHHLERAVPAVSRADAADAILRAADRALRLLAFEDAHALYGRAEALLDPAPEEAERRFEAILGVGIALMREARAVQGKATCERAAALARELGDAERHPEPDARPSIELARAAVAMARRIGDPDTLRATSSAASLGIELFRGSRRTDRDEPGGPALGARRGGPAARDARAPVPRRGVLGARRSRLRAASRARVRGDRSGARPRSFRLVRRHVPARGGIRPRAFRRSRALRRARAPGAGRRGARREPPGDAGPTLDDAAVRSYRAKLRSLREELEEAERFADGGRAEKTRERIDFLTRELSRAVGLGGRERRAGDAGERARTAVRKRLKDAIRRVEEEDADLGRHLDRSIRTGTFCVYRP